MEVLPHNFSLPWQTIPAMLEDNLARHAGKTAVVDGPVRLTYGQLQQRLYTAATELRSLGLGPGDVVAFWAPNSWQWVVGVTACWWNGCAVAPIPARGRILDAVPILRATRARLLLTCSGPQRGNYPDQIARYLSEQQSLLGDVCPELRGIVDCSGRTDHPKLDLLAFNAFDETCANPVPLAAGAAEPASVCEILFTSGSTGRPKGVLRQHRQVLGNRWSSSVRRGFRADDVLLAVSEFSHTLGLNGTLLRALSLGATLVLTDNRNPRELAALIANEGITAISAAPSMFASLLKQDIDGHPVCGKLRLASIGSARIPPELVSGLLDMGVDSVVSGYGMTECDSIASAGLAETVDTIANTVGRLESGFEIQITDEEGGAVAPGGSGEIWIRGDAVSPGYIDLEGRQTPVAGDDGWFRSGDMGRWTSDGYLQILGRKKEVICIHGYTLYPAELERLLSQSNMLDDVAVVGTPHALAGEMSVAFIVPGDPARFSLQALRRWAREHMADYKIPGRFIVLEALPLGANGKVDRMTLSKTLEA